MSSVKATAATALRIIVPLGILTWMVVQLIRDDPQSLQHLLQAEKNWWALLFALIAYFAAVMLTFGRWYILVRALRIPFQLKDAVRLGFIGYLFQFVSLGSVGGDLFKAVFLYREQQSRKAEAVATIFIDRVLGLLGLLVLASLAFFFLIEQSAREPFKLVGLLAVITSSIGVFAFFSLLYTSWSLRWVAARFAPGSKLRETVVRLQASLDLYRQSRTAVLGALMLSVLTHTLHAVTLYFASFALFRAGPSLAGQMVLWSIAGAIAAFPISPAGLGTFDLTYKVLYERLATGITVANPGTLVACLFRVLCLAVAAVGVVYYVAARRKSQPTSFAVGPTGGTTESLMRTQAL